MTPAPAKGPVILVEDDDTLREATIQTLELSGLEVQPFDSAVRAVRYVMPSFAGCIVTDIRMDGMDGLQLFAKVMEIDRQIPVVLITGHGDIAMAVRAMQDGAFDFLAKPFSGEHLAAVIRKALLSRQLVLDNRALRAALAKPEDDLVTQSRAMAQLRNMIGQVAKTDLNVLIEGETGTGKEMLARRIHQQSSTYAEPFVAVSCAILPPNTDLDQLIEQLGKGTLFLDGCHALPQSVQAKVIAALDARDRACVDNQGKLGFRVIASTPVSLSGMKDAGRISEDLYHRLSAISLRIPPLRERREDIPALFAKFVRDALDQTGKRRFEMNAADRKRLLEHDWPGNARELRNYVFGAVLNLPREALHAQNIAENAPLSRRVLEFERMVIIETLEAAGGNVTRACKHLGTARKTFYEKLDKHQIDPQRFRSTPRLS